MGMVRDGGMAVGEKNEDIEQEKRKGNGKRKKIAPKVGGGGIMIVTQNIYPCAKCEETKNQISDCS